jgi:hypothetical protein
MSTRNQIVQVMCSTRSGSLLSLLSRLQELEEFDYAVDEAFLVCLPDGLLQYHPNCRVNIWSAQTVLIEQKDDLFPLSGCDLSLIYFQSLHPLSLKFALELGATYEEDWDYLLDMLPFPLTAPVSST